MNELIEMIKKLPPNVQKEVQDYVEFLISKKSGKQGSKLSQKWAGALKEFRQKYTSLALEDKGLDWRRD